MTFLPYIFSLLALSCASMVGSLGKAALLASRIRIENAFEAEIAQAKTTQEADASRCSRALWRASHSSSMRKTEQEFSRAIASAPDSWSATDAIAKRDAWRATIRRPSSLLG